MLRVRVELVPFGIEPQSRDIHTIYIANMRQTKRGMVLYHAWLDYDPRDRGYPSERLAPAAVVYHKRDDGALALLEKVLKALRSKCATIEGAGRAK